MRRQGRAGQETGVVVVARWLAVSLLLGLSAAGANGSGGAAAAPAVVSTLALSAQARAHLQWVKDTGDHEGAPFVIIDKRLARLWVFDAEARPLGQAPVLLGLARGDASVEGIGERPMDQILPHERTTPAGRFIVEPGVNTQGEDIFWVDYEAAVSMHRVRAHNPAERRLERLASPSAADNRISYGCINVPATFYDRVLRPALSGGSAVKAPQSTRGEARRRPVVYLLPETLPRQALFKPKPGRLASRD
jgi:hypothetical protein